MVDLVLAPHGDSDSLVDVPGEWICRPEKGSAISKSVASVYMPMHCTKLAKSALLEKYQSLA